MSSLWGHLYNSFTRVHGWLLGLIGLGLGVLPFWIAPTTTIPLGAALGAAAVALLLIIVLLDAVVTAWRMARAAIPDVKRTLDAPSTYQGIERVLLLAPSELYAVDSLVSVYLKDGDYEQLIGVGRVLTIQTNGYVQVGVKPLGTVSAETAQQLKGNDIAFLKRLLVKPSIPSYVVPESSNG